MIGAIVGDIVGSVYEFANYKHKDFPLFGRKSFFTDDTICTIAVADCLLSGGDPAQSLWAWCGLYPDLSYGGRFRQWLSSPVTPPYKSFGNGAAMRVSPAAFLATSLEEARANARSVTEVTHNHEEGIKGALATTDAIWMAFQGVPPEAIRDHVSSTYQYNLSRSVDQIRPGYVFNESCQQTVPEAITCALQATDFEDAIRNAISIGGDSDTIACIAGGIAEARFGVPAKMADEAMDRLPEDLLGLVAKLYGSKLK